MDQAKNYMHWSALTGIGIGVLFSLCFLPPLAGIALGVLIATILWGNHTWREFALYGLIVGVMIALVTALIQMPGEKSIGNPFNFAGS